MRRLAKLLLITALLLSTGGHWALIQSAAWTGMIAGKLSEGSSVVEAFAKTFDGQHPCDLCKLVDRHSGDSSGSKDSKAPAGIKKTELFNERTLITFIEVPPDTLAAIRDDGEHDIQRGNAPPVPPPRAS